MNQSLYITNTITVNATPEKLWDVLTNPEKTKIYMFGCETVSNWKVGSKLLWKGSYEGKEMLFVTGKILHIQKPTKLIYTVFDPNSTMEDIPENHLEVAYELAEEKGGTTLTVTQGDYSKVGDGERRYKESYNNGEGWNPILVQVKKLAETN